MAFSGSTVCSSFLSEAWQGVHNLLTDTVKVALYTNAATLNAATTAYTTTGEVVDANYSAGGQTITSPTITIISGVPVFTFANPVWNPATFTARGALLYNSTHANKAICVMDFGQDRVGGPKFILQLPTADSVTGFLISPFSVT